MITCRQCLRQIAVGSTAVVMLLIAGDSTAAERAPTFESENQAITVAGRKTVTVYADNAASASAQAAKQNLGWTVEKVKKVNNDPKSWAYQVTLTK